MKLYDIPRDSKIRLPIANEAEPTSTEQVCIFHHIDGMHSYITTPSGSVVHLGASTEVRLGDDGIYEITPSDGE